jgi:hypothetical protein
MKLSRTLIVVIGLALVSCQTSASIEEDPLVKKSIVGFCHSMGSISYQEITRYMRFDSIEACIESGGKLPSTAEALTAPESSVIPTPDEPINEASTESEPPDEDPYRTYDPGNPPVKKSRTDICHEQGTRFYDQTKNFVPFGSIDECLNSGGRVSGIQNGSSKPTTSSSSSAGQNVDSQTSNTGGRSVGGIPASRPSSDDDSEPQVKKSDSEICHERGTRFYPRTKLYTPYESIEKCLASGGRLPKRQ